MKNTLITGATSKIGQEICRKLADQGHNLFLTGRNKNNLVSLTSNLAKLGSNKQRFFFEAYDFEQQNSVEELFACSFRKLGSLQNLVYNAGLYLWNPIERPVINSNKIEKSLLRINFEVPCLLSKLFVQQLKQTKRENQANIIFIGSISGLVGEANASLYSATKGALIGLTKSLALELAQEQISVNIINPGWVKTDLLTKDLKQKNFSEQEILETVPQGKWVRPSEIAELVSFLLSGVVNSITGQSINICAGLTLG